MSRGGVHAGAGKGAGAGSEIFNPTNSRTRGSAAVQRAINYDDYRRQKIDKLKQLGRQLLSDVEIRKDVLIYLSGEPKAWIKNADDSYIGKKNFNVKHVDCDGKKIACRHLAFEWLKRHKIRLNPDNYRSIFFSQDRIKAIPDLWQNVYDKNKIKQCADDLILTEYSSNGLGKALMSLCKNMQGGEMRHILVATENHIMAVVVQRKYNDTYIVKFYDPNSTQVHVRAVCHGLQGVSTLGLRDFIPKQRIDLYCPKNKVLAVNLYQQLDTEMLKQHDSVDILEEKPGKEEEPYTQAVRLSDYLYHALCFGKESLAISLITEGADVNTASNDGATPLFLAVCNGYLAVVKLLLARGAEANKAGNNGITPLWWAAQNGRLAVVELLLDRGAEVNKVSHDGVAPLWMAAQNGHLAVVELLLDRGADVNKAMNNGITPLWMAAQNGHLAVVELLLDRGADVNKAMNNGITPLWMAAQSGYSAVVTLLLARGAEVSKARNNGVTPLWVAAQNGHRIVVELLLDRGAEVNKVSHDGLTPLLLAAQNGHRAVVELLLDRGADVNKATNRGTTSLLLAAQNGHLAVVELLLDRGAKANTARNDGATPLWAAAKNGCLDVVQRLVFVGEDDQLGLLTTALQEALLIHAIETSNCWMVAALLVRGVSAHATNEEGLSVLGVANKAGDKTIISQIRAAIAEEKERARSTVCTMM